MGFFEVQQNSNVTNVANGILLCELNVATHLHVVDHKPLNLESLSKVSLALVHTVLCSLVLSALRKESSGLLGIALLASYCL